MHNCGRNIFPESGFNFVAVVVVFLEMHQGGKAQEDALEFDMLLHMPSGIHVMMTEDVISHIKDESSYLIVVENRHVILRPIVKD